MSRIPLYISLAAKCDRQAARFLQPELAAMWRTMGDQYRFLERLEREHKPIWSAPPIRPVSGIFALDDEERAAGA